MLDFLLIERFEKRELHQKHWGFLGSKIWISKQLSVYVYESFYEDTLGITLCNILELSFVKYLAFGLIIKSVA